MHPWNSPDAAPIAVRDKRIAMVQTYPGTITLDGHDAGIYGYSRRFATVSRLDGEGGDVEYAWSTVERVLTDNNGAFRSW
jgi:hypothetical protein